MNSANGLHKVPMQALLLVGLDEQQCHGGDQRAKPRRNSSELRRFGSGGVTVTGDCGCVVMTLPGSSFPVPVVGEAAPSQWTTERVAVKAAGRLEAAREAARGAPGRAR